MNTPAALLLSLTLAASPALAVVPDVTFRFEPRGFSGDSTTLVVRTVVPEGWYVQSNTPLDEFLIPTSVRASGVGLTFGEPVFPPHIVKYIEVLADDLALFEGAFEVKVPVRRKSGRVSQDALAKADVVLRYQACDHSQCLPPREVRAVYIDNR
jgi:hypothetical protein